MFILNGAGNYGEASGLIEPDDGFDRAPDSAGFVDSDDPCNVFQTADPKYQSERIPVHQHTGCWEFERKSSNNPVSTSAHFYM